MKNSLLILLSVIIAIVLVVVVVILKIMFHFLVPLILIGAMSVLIYYLIK
jgi:hypothetical protein